MTKSFRHSIGIAFLSAYMLTFSAPSASANIIIPETCPNGFSADECFNGGGPVEMPIDGIVNPASSTPKELIVDIIAFILDIILIIAVLMIVIAGVFLIISGGDEGQKDRAKRIVIYTAVGIVLILLSRAIVLFVYVAVKDNVS